MFSLSNFLEPFTYDQAYAFMIIDIWQIESWYGVLQESWGVSHWGMGSVVVLKYVHKFFKTFLLQKVETNSSSLEYTLDLLTLLKKDYDRRDIWLLRLNSLGMEASSLLSLIA